MNSWLRKIVKKFLFKNSCKKTFLEFLNLLAKKSIVLLTYLFNVFIF